MNMAAGEARSEGAFSPQGVARTTLEVAKYDLVVAGVCWDRSSRQAVRKKLRKLHKIKSRA